MESALKPVMAAVKPMDRSYPLKKPVVPTMFLSGLLCIILGRVVQGYDLSIGFTAAIKAR